jgi:hypothetical protein
VPHDAVVGTVVGLLHHSLANPGAQLGAFAVLHLDHDTGNTGDVAAVLHVAGQAPLRVREAIAAQIVHDGAFRT